MRKDLQPDYAAMPLGRIIVAAAFGCFFAGQAMAQDAASASPPAEAAQGDGGIEEIIVTANKRSENMQKVPIAITAVTAERLEKVGITTTQDLTQVVSGLAITTGPEGTRSRLRGVGTSSAGAGTENSVATYVDNVYILNMSGALVQLNNIAQVDVLKGPQGTLFGRNSTGGVISIRTRDPKQDLGGDFTVRYGNYDTLLAQGYLTGGLTENLAADIAGFMSIQGDGWGKNIFTGNDVQKQDQYAVRSKWLYKPGDRDQFRLIGDFSHTKGPGVSAQGLLLGKAVNYGPGNTTAIERALRFGPGGAPTADAQVFQAAIDAWVASGGAGGLAPFAVVGEPYVRRGGFYDIDTFHDPEYRFNTGGVSLQWDHEFDNLRFTSITAYRRSAQRLLFDNIPTPADRANAFWKLKGKQFSQELQLGSVAGSTVQWVAGLYYLYGTSAYPVFTIKGSSLGALESLTFHANQTTRSGAAFGQATVPLWTGAHLTGGLRYTIEERGITGDTVLQLLPAFGGANIVTGVTDDDTTFKKLTWRVALDQQVTPDTLLYASYNRGFKSGQYNAVPPSTVNVEPEVLDAFEVGLKTDLLDKHLRLNIAGFYYDYKNLQVTVFHTVSAVLENGAGAEVYGVDLDLTARLGPNLTLNGGATLMHSEFTSYDGAAFLVPQPISGGGTIQDPAVLHPNGAKGNELPFAPNFTFNLGANYTLPIGDGEADFNLNYSYTGRMWAGPDNILKQPSYGLLDGSLTYKFPGNHFELGVWARNITKEKYFVSLTAAANPGGWEVGTPGAPRTYGVMAGYKF